jgi:hypothetical protein
MKRDYAEIYGILVRHYTAKGCDLMSSEIINRFRTGLTAWHTQTNFRACVVLDLLRFRLSTNGNLQSGELLELHEINILIVCRSHDPRKWYISFIIFMIIIIITRESACLLLPNTHIVFFSLIVNSFCSCLVLLANSHEPSTYQRFVSKDHLLAVTYLFSIQHNIPISSHALGYVISNRYCNVFGYWRRRSDW